MPLRIQSLAENPLHVLPYRNAAPGSRGTLDAILRVITAVATGLPDALDGIVLTSDLQGIAHTEGGSVLLGEAVADALQSLGERGILPVASRLGVLLAGDLFPSPRADTRGASGDVRAVWRAFANRFRWVAGVAGNHDSFGTPEEARAFRASRGV